MYRQTGPSATPTTYPRCCCLLHTAAFDRAAACHELSDMAESNEAPGPSGSGFSRQLTFLSPIRRQPLVPDAPRGRFAVPRPPRSETALSSRFPQMPILPPPTTWSYPCASGHSRGVAGDYCELPRRRQHRRMRYGAPHARAGPGCAFSDGDAVQHGNLVRPRFPLVVLHGARRLLGFVERGVGQA